MTLGGVALVTDHLWLVDQRDTLKSASDAAAVAATIEMGRLLNQDPTISDTDLRDVLASVARNFVLINLSHLSPERNAQAVDTLVIDTIPDRAMRTVDVSAEADLGGGLLSQQLAFLADSQTDRTIRVQALVERTVNPIEVVLAIDISQSMEYCVDTRSRCRQPDDMRIAIVKRAAANLVEILRPSVDNQVAVGVVPWHMTVRLDPETRDEWERAGWARYPASRHYSAIYSCGRNRSCSAPAADHALPTSPPEPWFGCLDEHRQTPPRTHAGLPAITNLLSPPDEVPFAEAFFAAPYGTGYECLTESPPDRRLNYCYAQSEEQSSSTAPNWQYVQPPQFGCGEAFPTIQPLTSDRARIDAAIDELAAVGTLTYSALGISWGQRLLDARWKTTWDDPVHPVDPMANPDTRKALVLLTDGEDTYCDMGAGRKRACEDSTAGIARLDACAAAKAAGSEVFVIAAVHPRQINAAFADSLRACSSETPDAATSYVFLNNSTPENLEAAFADIASQLSSVRRLQ